MTRATEANGGGTLGSTFRDPEEAWVIARFPLPCWRARRGERRILMAKGLTIAWPQGSSRPDGGEEPEGPTLGTASEVLGSTLPAEVGGSSIGAPLGARVPYTPDISRGG